MIKGVAKGLGGVLHDAAKQSGEAAVDIANEAVQQVVGGQPQQLAVSPKSPAPVESGRDQKEIASLRKQLKPKSPESAPSLPPAANLEQKIAQARQERQQRDEDWEKNVLEQMKQLRQQQEEEVAEEAGDIMPAGKKKRGMAPWAVKGRQGTRETKAKKGG